MHLLPKNPRPALFDLAAICVVACTLLSVLFINTASATTQQAPAAFTNWPAGTDPVSVGQRIASNFLARPIYRTKTNEVVYPEICAWYGTFTWSRLAKDSAINAAALKRYDIFRTPEGAAMISKREHLDYRVYGVVPLEVAMETNDATARASGLALADLQWSKPDAAGLSHECRFWIDDMYMMPLLQLSAWRCTHDKKYLERTALTMAAYLDRLQQPNGLFFHAEDSPFFWGRGNGWFAAGMSEVLSELPESNPHHARILAGYKKMMATLLATQDSQTGLWRQLIDQPDCWTETSGSAMFAFAFVTGVKRGWLPADTYAPAARKAWLGLVAQLDKDGNLAEVCVGTNKAFKEVGADLKTQKDFYYARKRKVGDLHGQSPMLWTASALLR